VDTFETLPRIETLKVAEKYHYCQEIGDGVRLVFRDDDGEYFGIHLPYEIVKELRETLNWVDSEHSED
jgi:hypothetical protein